MGYQAKSFDLDLWCLSMGRESIDLQCTEIYGTFTHPNNDAKARTTFDTSHMIQHLQHTYLHVNIYKIDIWYHLIGNSHPILAGATDSRSNCRLPIDHQKGRHFGILLCGGLTKKSMSDRSVCICPPKWKKRWMVRRATLLHTSIWILASFFVVKKRQLLDSNHLHTKTKVPFLTYRLTRRNPIYNIYIQLKPSMKVIDSLSCRISENSKRSAAKSCKDVCVKERTQSSRNSYLNFKPMG